MTTISKILTVAITVFSLFFLGFASIMSVGGRNWESDMNELPEFTFSLQAGEQPTWSSTHRVSGETVASSQYLPEVILKSWQKLQQERQQKIQEIEAGIERYEPLIAQNKAIVEADLKALAEKFQQLVEQKKAIKGVTAEVAAELNEANQETIKLQGLIAKRREDVQRLTRILQGIRTEHARLMQDRLQIEQSIVRLKGSIAKLERRNQQLEGVDQKVSSTAKAQQETKPSTIK